MNLESQVVSLPLAMRLRKLGLKKKSVFLWEYYDIKCYAVKYSPFAVAGEYDGFKLYPAYTVAELGEMLRQWYINEMRQKGDWLTRIFDMPKYVAPCYETAYEADDRAEMLIYLIENNHVKAEDL